MKYCCDVLRLNADRRYFLNIPCMYVCTYIQAVFRPYLCVRERENTSLDEERNVCYKLSCFFVYLFVYLLHMREYLKIVCWRNLFCFMWKFVKAYFCMPRWSILILFFFFLCHLNWLLVVHEVGLSLPTAKPVFSTGATFAGPQRQTAVAPKAQGIPVSSTGTSYVYSSAAPAATTYSATGYTAATTAQTNISGRRFMFSSGEVGEKGGEGCWSAIWQFVFWHHYAM